MCCSVLQCVAACCSVLQRVAIRQNLLPLHARYWASIAAPFFVLSFILNSGTNSSLFAGNCHQISYFPLYATFWAGDAAFAVRHTATHCCNTLQHTATHCNTLQHTVTHCNIRQHTATHGIFSRRCSIRSFFNLNLLVNRSTIFNLFWVSDLDTNVSLFLRRFNQVTQHPIFFGILILFLIAMQFIFCNLRHQPLSCLALFATYWAWLIHTHTHAYTKQSRQCMRSAKRSVWNTESSVLQCVAVCCSVLQCVAVHCHVLPCWIQRASSSVELVAQ